jgi:hypothetical protein
MKNFLAKTAVAVLVTTGAMATAQASEGRIPLSVLKLNKVVDQTNFIVDGGCSGTLIGDPKHKLVMTAHHCIDRKIRWIEKDVVVNGEVKKQKVEIRLPVNLEQKVYRGSTQVGGAQYKADIIAYSDVRNGTDLALLKIKADKIPMTMGVPMLPAGREAMRAEPVWAIGNPAGLDASITEGIIVSMTREYKSPTGNKVQLIQTSTEVFFGNSGGVLLSQDGFYLGTISRGRPGTAIIFAMHYNHIRDMLDEHCYAELYDSDADSHADCIKAKEEKATAKEKTVKELLQELIAKQK